MNAKVTVLPKRDLNHIYTEASINRRLVKKGWNFSGPQRKRKPREDTTYLLFFVGSFVVRFSMLMTSFQSVFWSVFVFPSRIFSSLDIRFTRIASRLLLIAFFGRFVSFFPGYFHSKPSLHELELLQFPPVDKALVLLVFLFCELIRNCKILRITVQLQSHQFDFALKTWFVYYLLTWPHIN